MTQNEREIIEHALGIRPGRTSYRNHFVTGPGSDDFDACVALVAKGWMTRAKGNEITGGDDYFRVTEAGRAALALTRRST